MIELCVSSDSSLTCDRLLTDLDTVIIAQDSEELENSDGVEKNDGILEDVLQIPITKRKEMWSQFSGEDYRKKLVEYYIAIYPLASWNYVAGNLLYYQNFGAYDKVKRNVKVDEGMHVVGDTY